MFDFKKLVLAWIFCFPLITFAAKENTLLTDFIRLHESVPNEYRNKIFDFFIKQSDDLKKIFISLKAPENLKLVISDSILTSGYRGGELIVPYRFVSPNETTPNMKLAEVLWNYYLGLAYFDANMIFTEGKSKSWDTYFKTYLLIKEIFANHAAIDEGLFLTKDNRNKDFLDISQDEVFRIADQAKRNLIKLTAEFKARGKSREIRYLDTYVSHFHSYFSILFADLFVAIQHQDPLAMSEALNESKIPEWVSDAPYRGFNTISSAVLASDPSPSKFTHFFTPIRERLWHEIIQNNATKEQQLKALENIFARMKFSMENILSKIDSKIKSGTINLGETGEELLNNLGLSRNLLLDQISPKTCKIELELLGTLKSILEE